VLLFHELIGPRFLKSERMEALLNKAGVSASAGEPEVEAKPKKRGKGHGRNGVAKLTGAHHVKVGLKTPVSHCLCPGCSLGKVYDFPPSSVPHFWAQPLVQATVYEFEQVRCNLCGEIFSAPAPDDMPKQKYDETVPALIGFLKYGAGMTLYRIDKLQQAFGVPLPESTQWEILEDAADKLTPVHEALLDAAAQGEQFYNDDTSMKVVQMTRPQDDTRTGTRTSGVISELKANDNGFHQVGQDAPPVPQRGEHAQAPPGHPRVALYFTGRQLAGESLSDVLKRRASGLPRARQMCDGSDHNIPKCAAEFEIILCNCLGHGRRYFVDVFDNFPTECRFVLDKLATVYHIDAEARGKQMSAQQRLEHHQAFSAQVMEDLKTWMEDQLSERKTEPNSGLGKAIRYFLKHWTPLTMFLRVAGAPLDNNLCERALKTVVLHRKNALFYRTLNGARVGDLFMSLIHTCKLNNVDPFRYLTVLLKRIASVRENPGAWMPWNYHRMLDRAGPTERRSALARVS